MIFPTIEDTAFVIIDMQEKFLNAISEMSAASDRISVMLKAMNELKCPVMATEQYPQGLGPTIDPLRSLFTPEVTIFDKKAFSVLSDENCRRQLASEGKKNLIICGVEAHVCVLQTALEGLEHSYNVYVPYDCVASRRPSDKETSLSYMRHAGIHVLSSESILFMLLGTSEHPSFKAVSKIIR